MRYGSVCSGIEAASLAWHGGPLNWEPVFFSEIEAFPRSYLAHHYPDVPNHGDMTKFQEWPDHAIDLLVGGTPCQSFSIAGLRAGLADPRGNLMLTYLAIAAKYRPRWLVWENVPGVLSSNRGRDFGTFLGALGQLGYGFGYRVLDAQYVRASGFPHAVPQRRRRVFVVGHFGDWRPAAAVLFDAESLRGDHPPRRETRQVIAPALSTGARGYGDFELSGGLIPEVAGTMKAVANSGGWSNSADHAAAGYMIPSTGDVAHCLNAGSMGRQDPETETMVAQTIGADHYNGLLTGNVAATLSTGGATTTGSGPSVIVPQPIAYRTDGDGAVYEEGGKAAPLTTGTDPSANVVQMSMAVRRLTPRECERLQGFPDDFTLVPHRGKPAADGPRYKALGNSMAVNVMRALGERIQLVDDLISLQLEERAA